MKKIIFSLLVISLFGCATGKDSVSRSPNVFNLNGRNISLPDSMLLELRKNWKDSAAPIITSTLLSEADVRWSLDYISLIETIKSKDCHSLNILETRNFDLAKDTDSTGARINPGLFDYVWDVQVCDVKKSYRLVNQKGKSSFTLYPLDL